MVTLVRSRIGMNIFGSDVSRQTFDGASPALRALGFVLAVKYASQVVLIGLRNSSLPVARTNERVVLGALAAVCWALVAWRPRSRALGVGFLLMFLDATFKIAIMGPFFLNHFLLEAVLGSIGAIAVYRSHKGAEPADAWRPVALLTLAV